MAQDISIANMLIKALPYNRAFFHVPYFSHSARIVSHQQVRKDVAVKSIDFPQSAGFKGQPISHLGVAQGFPGCDVVALQLKNGSFILIGIDKDRYKTEGKLIAIDLIRDCYSAAKVIEYIHTTQADYIHEKQAPNSPILSGADLGAIFFSGDSSFKNVEFSRYSEDHLTVDFGNKGASVVVRAELGRMVGVAGVEINRVTTSQILEIHLYSIPNEVSRTDERGDLWWLPYHIAQPAVASA